MTTTELLNQTVQNFYLKEASDPNPFNLPPDLELSMFDPNHMKTSDKMFAASFAAFLTSMVMSLQGVDYLSLPVGFFSLVGMIISGIGQAHYERKNNIIPIIKYMSPSCSILFSQIDDIHMRRKIVGVSGGDEEIKNAIITALCAKGQGLRDKPQRGRETEVFSGKFLRETEN
jgi:hypothetical protein